MDYDHALIEKTRQFAQDLVTTGEPGKYPYHSLQHLQETAEAARLLAEAEGLDQKDTTTVILASWLHDAAFVTSPENHEEESARIAREFLDKAGASTELQEAVSQCILATKLPHTPSDTLQKVLCDADLAHLASDNYPVKSELLRRERETVHHEHIGKRDWAEKNISFFHDHRFFTRHAQEHWTPKKEKNLVELYRQRDKKNAKKAKTKVEKKTESRGVERNMEVYYRTSSRNHVSFSANVDQKANIMIQTNSLIFSIIISLLVRKLDEFPNLVIPTFILLLTCVATIVTSVLATRPKVTRHETTTDDVRQRKANLLFFGSFVNMQQEEYEWGVQEMLKDKPYYIANMIRDTYYLGKVLDQKYRYLRLSYDIFMVGLVTSIILYTYAFIG